MIQAGFLDPESRQDLTELAPDGSARIVWRDGPTLWCCSMTA
jgi:hypothetical protein